MMNYAKVLEENKISQEMNFYNMLKPKLLKLKDEFIPGCRLELPDFFDGDLKKLFSFIENDDVFVDEENHILIWDDNFKKKYQKLSLVTCRLKCNREGKGSCCGCKEYITARKRAGYFITTKLKFTE